MPLHPMLKKFLSILMLYSALAIMLGHNFIPHHHHNFEHHKESHHHKDGHHHDDDSEDESDDWGHLFSGLHHGAEGLTFLTSHTYTEHLSKQFFQFTAPYTSKYILYQVIIEARQNAPPYIVDYHNSQYFLPSGLRAPPIFIV